MFLHAEIQFGKLFLEILVHMLVGERVSRFVDSVASPVDLEAVIGQMDEGIELVHCVLVWGGSDVALAEHVDLEFVRYKDPNSDIKFSFFI